MSRSKTSPRWLDEHFSDEFVKRAQQEGYRGRAVYKLQELDQRYGLIRRGINIVDLGAAPGSWSEYASRQLDGQGRIVASDMLPMDSIAGVEFVQGDFREESVLEALLATLGERKADLVMSDMAPNMSGMDAVDQPRAMDLADLTFDLAQRVLVPGGNMVAKLFQGEGFDAYVGALKQSSNSVIVRKPKASRPRSREVYVLARGINL
ncbi:MAG: 23S rRNA (uridine(2552)-2'-O)-methyltransferase RlmE [Thiotrichales bacterium]